MTASVSGGTSVFWSTFFDPRAAFVDGLPVLYDHRHISVPAISILPSPRVDIFSSAETGFETARFSVWRAPPCPPAVPLDGFGWRWILCRKLRYRNAVNCQKPPQASILLAEANIFLLRRFEWKSV
jgi:hypothetical protein